jgi:hypothetical protein
MLRFLLGSARAGARVPTLIGVVAVTAGFALQALGGIGVGSIREGS